MKFILPIVFILFAGALLFVYIEPAYTRVGELSAEQAIVSEALDRARDIAAKRDALVATYNSFSDEDKRRIVTMLPDSQNDVQTVLDLDALASSYSMTIQDITIAGSNEIVSDPTSPYETITLSFGVQTTYANIVDFLATLEKSLRIMEVTSMSFASEGGAPQYQITLEMYRMREPSAGNAATAAPAPVDNTVDL